MKRESERPEWLERCLARDRRAQHAFYEEHFAYLMRIAFNFTKQRETALEWVNLGFAKIFLNLAKYDPSMPLGTWMGKVLSNVILDELRKERRHADRHVEADVQSLRHLEASWEVPGEAAELMHIMERGLEDLPPTTRQVFKLYAIEGYPHQEIAERLRIPVGTSHWHFSKARKHLQHVINRTWNLA